MEEWALRAEELERRAAALAPHLQGMSIDAAAAEVAKHPGLAIRFTRSGIVTADYRPGRITAFEREGVVTSPDWLDQPEPGRQASENWTG